MSLCLDADTTAHGHVHDTTDPPVQPVDLLAGLASRLELIDTLRLVSTIPFDVEKTASGVTLYSTSVSNPEPPGIPLPIHIHV
jgi:hypothetical protein